MRIPECFVSAKSCYLYPQKAPTPASEYFSDLDVSATPGKKLSVIIDIKMKDCFSDITPWLIYKVLANLFKVNNIHTRKICLVFAKLNLG